MPIDATVCRNQACGTFGAARRYQRSVEGIIALIRAPAMRQRSCGRPFPKGISGGPVRACSMRWGNAPQVSRQSKLFVMVQCSDAQTTAAYILSILW
jgi:hypothetical protein